MAPVPPSRCTLNHALAAVPSTSHTYAHVLIPKGATATHVIIYGSGEDAAVVVYGKIPSTATETSKGSGNVGEDIDISDVVASYVGAYLAIKITPGDPDADRFYGGRVTVS